MSTDSSGERRSPPRVIDALGAFALVAGSMIGIGIFLSPPIVATYISSPSLFLALWAIGGLTALAGAVACAELGTMMPRAGGDYVIQHEAFGPSVAFASGWILFGAIFSGSIATMAVGLCSYQLPVLLGIDLSLPLFTFPWGHTVSRAETAAVALVPALTFLNVLGAKPSARAQTVLTLAPIAVMLLLAVAAIVRGGAGDAPSATAPPAVALTMRGLATAYMAVYFAYSGWINIIYVAGEVSQPQRNIPRALIWGTLSITVLYLLLCFGFLRVLGMEGLPSAGEAGTAMAGILGGRAGELVITVLIASALLASINATVMGGARVAYAMGERGAGWPILGTVDPQTGVPHRALWVQAVIAIALILSGRFEQLYTLVSLTMLVTGSLTVASVFVLRRRSPDFPRPYRATGYPLLPALYVLSSALAVGVMLEAAIGGEPGAWYPVAGLGAFFALWFGHLAYPGGNRGR